MAVRTAKPPGDADETRHFLSILRLFAANGMQFSATDGTDSHGYEDLQDKSERSSCQSCSSCPNYAFPAKELFTAEVAEGRGEDANAIHRKSSLRPPASSAVELMFWLRRSRPGHFARFRGHCSLRAAASGRETIPAFPNPLTSGERIVSIRYGLNAMTNNQTRMTNEESAWWPVSGGQWPDRSAPSGHWPLFTNRYLSILPSLPPSSCQLKTPKSCHVWQDGEFAQKRGFPHMTAT